MPTLGMRWGTFDDESHPSDRFGMNDSCAVALAVIWILSWRADLFRPFLKRFVLITIAATCHFLAGMEFLAVASRSSLGLVAPSPADAPDLLASLPGVMAPEALAFCSPTESWPLSCATVVCLAGPTPHRTLVEPMPP